MIALYYDLSRQSEDSELLQLCEDCAESGDWDVQHASNADANSAELDGKLYCEGCHCSVDADELTTDQAMDDFRKRWIRR